MACAQADGVGRTCQVEVAQVILGRSQCGAQRVDALLQGRFQFVEQHADFALLLGSHGAELTHELVDDTFLAQVFDAEVLQLLCVMSLERGHFLQQRFDFV